MQYVGIVLLVVGLVVSLIGSVQFIIVAFREHIVWGICILLGVPFAALIFVVKYWEESRKPFLLQITGLIIFFASAFAFSGEMLGQMRERMASGEMPTNWPPVEVVGALHDEDEVSGAQGDDFQLVEPGEEPQSALLGLSEIEVRRVMGNPRGEFTSKGLTTWIYDGQEVTFESNRVIRVE